MDISNANTEPFFLLHRFNEEFNRNMRIAVGALGVVTRMKRKRTAKKVLKLSTLGEPWGAHTVWKDVVREIPGTKRFLSQIGIVRVFSAFEDFLIGAKSEFDRNAHLRGLEGSQNASQDLPVFYGELGWDDRAMKPLIPLFDYFVVVRNCVAHQSGRTNATLVELAAGQDLKKCLRGWKSKRNKKPPPLPKVALGKEIPLLPRHAVLAAEVCYRIALDINEKLRDSLGSEGLVYMAAYHALLSEDRIQSHGRKFPESLINFVLTNRYRIDLDKREVIGVLKSIGKWNEYRRTFERLFPRLHSAEKARKRK
jgi:hypothetical protein